jgi:hypothetical protein
MRTQINQSPLQARSTQVAISRLRRRKVHPKQQQQNDTNASQQVHEPAPQNTQAHHCCSLLTKETKIVKKTQITNKRLFLFSTSLLFLQHGSTRPRFHSRKSAQQRCNARSSSLRLAREPTLPQQLARRDLSHHSNKTDFSRSSSKYLRVELPID